MDTPAKRLLGVTLDDGWFVDSFMHTSKKKRPGNFSIGYRVTRGVEEGFLKAQDYWQAFDSVDFTKDLELMARAHNHEKDLIFQCRDRRLTRIIKGITSGSYLAPAGDSKDKVSYIIFEIARGDVLNILGTERNKDRESMLTLAHHATVAVRQLHSTKITHQDIKPGNLLYFELTEGLSAKLGDLGCAHVEGAESPRDDFHIAGDVAYAPPELHYKAIELLPQSQRRIAADLHMLGNLICWLLAGTSYNMILYMILPENLRPYKSAATFEGALPGLIDAHTQTLEIFKNKFPRCIADDLAKIVGELCFPDPRRRGLRAHGTPAPNPFDLARFVSRLDLLRYRLRVSQRVNA
jgi:serine/threonine protein kinase